MAKFTLLLIVFLGINQSILAQEDKYQWLEDINGEKALEFVYTENQLTIEKLTKEKYYVSLYEKILERYNSSDRITYPTIHGTYVYNFWQDEAHERGIWRRCLLTDYTKGKFEWETLLDIDELSKKDNIKWVYRGAEGLFPSYNRFLIRLSKGGGDANVILEFDVEKKQFVENGFNIEEARGVAYYVDANTIMVSSAFGEDSKTASGFPRQARLWKRGTLLKDAQLVYEGLTDDVATWSWILRDGMKTYVYVSRHVTRYSVEKYIWVDNKIIKLDIPDDCTIRGLVNDQLVIQLKTDWQVETVNYKTGMLLSLNFTELLKGNRQIELILEPDEFSSITHVSSTKNHLLINMLSNVTSQLYSYSFYNGKWTNQKVPAPDLGALSIISADEFSDQYFFDFENLIISTTLYFADAKENTIEPIQSLPAYFDASKYEVKQFKAKSKDGTLVPYFMVSAKDIEYNGKNPTLIGAYGGFEVSVKPYYAATYGISWLEQGGVIVLANIRGGGEFGPKWHQDGIKEKRQNVFNDFYAISEDLITKKITSPKHLGIAGASNGGLLVGVAFTQRPDLYNAVVCQVPLLDMQRYTKLLAGASWIAEYGDPDIPEEWEYLKKYSPYHNLKEGMNYPEVFFSTSTLDDRVHPGHARKMMAKMKDMGYKTYYYEETEGGHSGISTNDLLAKEEARMFTFLLMKLK